MNRRVKDDLQFVNLISNQSAIKNRIKRAMYKCMLKFIEADQSSNTVSMGIYSKRYSRLFTMFERV